MSSILLLLKNLRYLKILVTIFVPRMNMSSYFNVGSRVLMKTLHKYLKKNNTFLVINDKPVGDERFLRLWLCWRQWCNLKARPVSSLADNEAPEVLGDRMLDKPEVVIALLLVHPAEDADFLSVVFLTDSNKSRIRIRFFSSGCHSIQSLQEKSDREWELRTWEKHRVLTLLLNLYHNHTFG